MTLDLKTAAMTADGYCPVRAALAILGQKWVPRIVYELKSEKRRFNELSSIVGGCNSRTLRDRLKALETLGIVDRQIVATMPPWVEYELTAMGRELAEALTPLEDWGHRYLETP
ncbi:MAG: helix-turn-helix domain-containing protein [Dehalococcoidia bacterium]